jgi:hypothetical protein
LAVDSWWLADQNAASGLIQLFKLFDYAANRQLLTKENGERLKTTPLHFNKLF